MEEAYTVFLCDCKISKLEQNNINFYVNTYINEFFYEKRRFFAAFCSTCPYNVSNDFERNYFSATNCHFSAEKHTFFVYITQELNKV